MWVYRRITGLHGTIYGLTIHGMTHAWSWGCIFSLYDFVVRISIPRREWLILWKIDFETDWNVFEVHQSEKLL